MLIIISYTCIILLLLQISKVLGLALQQLIWDCSVIKGLWWNDLNYWKYMLYLVSRMLSESVILGVMFILVEFERPYG